MWFTGTRPASDKESDELYHGRYDRDFRRIAYYCDTMGTRPQEVMIVLGDAGINYFGGQKDKELKRMLSELPITLFCIYGNHEQRPVNLPGYREAQWHGGMVYMEDEFPNLLFAKDGELFDFDGKRCLVIGGAYSVDKADRLENGWGWWPDEQPDDAIKCAVEAQLEACGHRVDVVLSHTAPLKYEPMETFNSAIDQSTVDKSMERWLDTIEDRLTYDRWYCGHYHTEKRVGKLTFLYRSILSFS